MSHTHRIARIFSLAIIILIVAACAKTSVVENKGENKRRTGDPQWTRIDLNEFGEGSEIRGAGLQLMDHPSGLLELVHGESFNDSLLIVAVHGYQSGGYEWITGLKNLGSHFGSLFFFRYDWSRCPEEIANDLVKQLNDAKQFGQYKKIVLFGHSYGGLVVTQAASKLGNVNAEINVIAAPLAGFPDLLDHCGDLHFPEWIKKVKVIQHKTVHAQDGAFRELELDPQLIDLPFYQTHELPPTMDGHRLGHNWSVSWVLDQYIGKLHRL